MEHVVANRRLLHNDYPYMLPEEIQIIMIIGTIIYLELFWLPFLAYKLYGLMQYKHTNEFRKRRPLYLVLLYIIVLFHIALQEPLSLLILYPSHTFFTDSNFNYSALTGGIIHICHFFVCLGFFLLYLARAWILYHDYRFNDCVANLCWRLEIQPTYKHDNWWISKRSIYGNAKFILSVLLVMWILLMLIYCILYFVVSNGTHTTFDTKVSVIIQWILAVLAIITVTLCYAVVVIKIRAITDVFKIKQELNATNRICLLCVFLFCILLIISTTTDISMDAAPMACIASWVTCTAAGITIYLNTRYIQKSVEANYENRRNSISRSKLREYNIPDMNLEDVLEDRIGFESFMKHLVQEFSVENLLFVAEVQQFRRTLNYEATEKELNEEKDIHTLNLEWLPLSIGLKNDSPWLRAQYIYAKFICKTALHQVNISHRVWRDCTKFFPELQRLNDTNNVAALPTKGSYRSLPKSNSYNYYYTNSMKYSISSNNYNTMGYLDMPETKKKKLIEEKKKSMKSSVDGTVPKINRRVEKRRFRALSDKYLKRNDKKLKKKGKHFKSPTAGPIFTKGSVELSETPKSNKHMHFDESEEEIRSEWDPDSFALSGVKEENSCVVKKSESYSDLVSFKYELYHVFDGAEKEVWMLMKDSLTRYQQTSTYEKMAIGKALRKRRKTDGQLFVDEFGRNFWKELKKIGKQAPAKNVKENKFFGNNRKTSDLRQPLLEE